MSYRHEWKIEINFADQLALRARLSALLSPDPHAVGGRYAIRTLYFDTPTDRALREKLDGANPREKFRLRYYNGDLSYLVLERKCKIRDLCQKESVRVTAEEAARLFAGERDWLSVDERPLCRLLGLRMQTGLRPKTVVEYTREPFVYPPGNVRVTLDYDIRTGLSSLDFLNPDSLTLPAGNSPRILEVKWDAFLPELVRCAVTLPGRRASAFSKYAQSRIYG